MKQYSLRKINFDLCDYVTVRKNNTLNLDIKRNILEMNIIYKNSNKCFCVCDMINRFLFKCI